jgi:hypothetical protein
MPTFHDTAGREWSIKFDGLLLRELRDEHKINLADLGGVDYARIEADAAALVESLCCLCGEQIKAAGLTSRQFAAAITGDALDAGLQAIWEAAQQFFPLGKWSVLESNYAQQVEMRQALAMLPPNMQGELMSGALETLLASKSATGPAAAP